MDNHIYPDFIAIDFETAATGADSACAVGVAVVKDGAIIDRYYSLIQPPANRYDSANIAVHGITPEDTEAAPSFGQIWEQGLSAFFTGVPVAAHNAPFDLAVLAACCAQSGVVPRDFYYLDTVRMAKGIVEGSRRLDSCARWFGIELAHHHNALADAEACAMVALACIRTCGAVSFADYCLGLPRGGVRRFSELAATEQLPRPQTIRKFERVSPKDIHPCAGGGDPGHPLCGKSIVFTGELSIDRRSAMQMAADVGALVKSGVSKKTDYLVVGAQDPTLVGDDGRSTKEEKAYELNESGKANICILSEKEFIDLVKACPSAGKELTQV